MTTHTTHLPMPDGSTVISSSPTTSGAGTAPPLDGGQSNAGAAGSTDHGTGANAGTQTPHDAATTAAERRYTQEDIDRVVSERLNRQRAQLAREAEDAKLKQQQEWQQLAQSHETRVKELEPQIEALTKGVEARDAVLLKTVKAETKDWPPEAKALIPQEGDALQQMAAVDSARALVAKLGEPGPRTPGNSAGPRPAGEPNKSLVEREMERLRASGSYGNRQPGPAPHP